MRRFERNDLGQVGERAFMIAHEAVDIRPQEVCGSPFWSQCDGLGEIVGGRLEVLKPRIGEAAIVIRIGLVGIEFNSAAVVGDRLVVVSIRFVEVAATVERLGPRLGLNQEIAERKSAFERAVWLMGLKVGGHGHGVWG